MRERDLVDVGVDHPGAGIGPLRHLVDVALGRDARADVEELADPGLAESRTRPIDDGLTALRAALTATLTAPAAPLTQLCQTVGEQLREHGEDDITLLLART